MPGSLKCEIAKLRYKRLITEDEYLNFIKKIDGHDRELYDKAYAEGKSRQLFAEIKIDKDMMQKMVDEKFKEFEVDIQKTRNAAIDEFAEALKKELRNYDFWKFDVVTQYGVQETNVPRDWIVDEIAEQMKGSK